MADPSASGPLYNSAAPFNNHARIEMLGAAPGSGATRIEAALGGVARSGRTALDVEVQLHDAEGRLVADMAVQWHLAVPRAAAKP